MTDVESRLRDSFAADAAATPEADVVALAGAVRGTVRDERRRRAAVAAAVLVLGVVGGGLAVARLAPGTVLPATQQGPASSAEPPSGAAEPALRWRGVVVPVPEAYLDPAAVRCGVPVADAAYVVDPVAPVLRCDAVEAPAHPELTTTVVLMASDVPPGNGERYAEPEQVLPDGRTQVTSAIPGAPVRLVVTSPDPALAHRLFDRARIETDLAGCTLRASGAPHALVQGASGLPALEAVDGSVCSYTSGWLHSWRRLSAAEAAGLVTALRAPLPPGGQRVTMCDALGGRPDLSNHWTVTLRGTPGGVAGGDGSLDLWVSPGPCIQAGTYTPTGARVPLTQAVVDRLTAWAPGIPAVYDVVGSPRP